MKKIKYLLFLIPFLFSFNVFAQNVSSSIRCSYKGSGSSYYGDPNDGFNSARCYDIGTRYTPRLGYIEFYLPTSSMSFSANKSYTVTMNMATNDWRNHIMLQSVRYVNSSGNVITSSPLPTMSNFRFISKKQIKFDFKLPSGTVYPYLRFIISSPTYANPDPDISSSVYMTGDSNWNLSSIDISPVNSSSGGSSGGSSTPTPTPSASNKDIIYNANQNTDDIMNNANQNTTDIINNNNHNTQDIIDNQNKNQEQTNQLLGQCFTNIYNISHIDNIYNFLNNNGVFVQKDPDSNNYSKDLKLQFFNDNTLVSQSSYTPVLAVGRFKFDFTKNSNFNNIRFGVNGSEIDTLIAYDVSYLKDNHDYSLIFDISNAENGSVTLEKIMITDKVSYLLPYMSYNETTCNSKLDTVGQSVLDGAQSIIGNNNQNTQNIIEGVQNGAKAITDNIDKQLMNCTSQIPKYLTSFSGHIYGGTGGMSFNPSNTNILVYEVPEVGKEYSLVFNKGSRLRIGSSDTLFTSMPNVNTFKLNYVFSTDSPVVGNTYTFTVYNKYIYINLYSAGQGTSNFNDLTFNGVQICTNRIDQTNKGINDINDSLTDETTPEIDLDLDLDTNSPVSDLLTMPLTILNKVFNITDDTCQPYVLPFDFSGGNNTITFPCIDLKNYLGNTVYNILDTILCFYLCYQIGMMCISIYEDITSLHDSFDSLYTPKHGKPLGKHTKEVY